MTDTTQFPILPLRDVVLFPHAVKSFYVGRNGSVMAIDSARDTDARVLVLTQRDPEVKQLGPDDLYPTGTVAKIIMNNAVEDGMIKVSLRGLERARVSSFVQRDPFMRARVELLGPTGPVTDTVRHQRLMDALEKFASVNKKFPADLLADLQRTADLGRVTDLVANLLTGTTDAKQKVLEAVDPLERSDMVSQLLLQEIEMLDLERQIKKQVKKQMEKNQRDYYLNEKIKAIQKELGQDQHSEIDELTKKVEAKNLPEYAEKRAKAEIKKLGQMSPMAAEATVVRGYLDWILALPWRDYKPVDIDLAAIKAKLDADHYGLEEIKDRILEHLSVLKLNGTLKGPKLLFVGPPGVGKTSLARSIAEGMGLDFVRHSLGGVRDEAEIRGHRRTYIGSMPGRILQGLKKCKTGNPVFLLDEVDKMSADFRGDPSAALLEVLDPEQNDTFMDHYLDLEYDLSNIFFIATANSLAGIPGPLLDRMEVIELNSYMEQEKVEIGLRHLMPRQLKRQGLEPADVELGTEGMREIIQGYCREAGVRSLERKIEELFRKLARRKVEALAADKPFTPPTLDAAAIRDLLGPRKYQRVDHDRGARVGVANGLAWTSVGGELLTIEVNLVPGTGKVTVTGKLGDVMKESAQAALSVVRKRAARLGIKPAFHGEVDIHIHVPEGAVPKDGPSAGITMATALASELTGLPVRPDVAMTGEITLRGRVLPIGGLREKLLAAVRGDIRTVLIPVENEPDLVKVPEAIRSALQIIPVHSIDEVLGHALAFHSEAEKDVYEWLEAHPPTPDYGAYDPAARPQATTDSLQ